MKDHEYGQPRSNHQTDRSEPRGRRSSGGSPRFGISKARSHPQHPSQYSLEIRVERRGGKRERERERERGRERGRERERERISERSGDSFGAIIGRVYLYIGRADAPRTERNPAGAIPPI